jgi:putative transposase
MDKCKVEGSSSSRPEWNSLEAFVREQVQQLIQAVLEEEVTELLGRRKSERRRLDAEGYRNGHGKPRKVALTCGTISVRRPLVRGLDEPFRSKVLPLFVRKTNEVAALLPELYLHGLALGDFELAMRGLLGAAAPLSASSIARLRTTWTSEYEAWSQRRFDDQEVVYVWADGIYVKAGLEKEKAALLVLIGAMRDGTKKVLTVVPGHRESEPTWSDLLRDLKQRGLQEPACVIADGALGIWAAIGNVWPQAKEQRCWNHKTVNVLDKLPKKDQPEAKELLKAMAYADTLAQAAAERAVFEERFADQPRAVKCIVADWDRMTTFFSLPKEHWKHLRTTNIIESPFAAVRLRTDAAKRFKKVESATAMLWKLLMVAESELPSVRWGSDASRCSCRKIIHRRRDRRRETSGDAPRRLTRFHTR